MRLLSLIQVTRSSMPDFEEYIEEIRELLENHWITNMEAKHKQLEAALNLTGEVFATPFASASTTHAIVRNGLEPVFCDINSYDYTIDVEKLESIITDKTSAIIPVHVYDNICNAKEIERIAKKHN